MKLTVLTDKLAFQVLVSVGCRERAEVLQECFQEPSFIVESMRNISLLNSTLLKSQGESVVYLK